MTRPPRKILMVISSLSGGGAERVAVLLARGFVQNGHTVSLATIYGRDRDFYELPAEVDRLALDLGRDRSNAVQKLAGNARRIWAIRQTIRRTQPAVVLSFMNQTNVTVLLAATGLGVPVIVTEHMDPRRDDLPAAWRWLRKWTYARAARLVSVSRAVDSFFAWLPADRRAVIPNPVALDDVESRPAHLPALPCRHTVIAMGRLAPEKGFDLLIRAYARLVPQFPDWGLTILGEGPQRGELESLARVLTIEDRFRLPGAVGQPFAALKQADLFVLSSRHEGFGNALVEAMACGLPVVAADCWSISPEIVHDRVDGLLIPPDNPDALAAALATLMRDESLRRQLGRAATESARRFELPAVMSQWEELLGEVG
ncbi:MAG: glycosyltransferase family 4 protein [Pirellulales bacterium]|nr:glycosyltransferase family 4 protein [Pirellulales bacterium]